jgi:hypothetical protein
LQARWKGRRRSVDVCLQTTMPPFTLAAGANANAACNAEARQ